MGRVLERGRTGDGAGGRPGSRRARAADGGEGGGDAGCWWRPPAAGGRVAAAGDADGGGGDDRAASGMRRRTADAAAAEMPATAAAAAVAMPHSRSTSRACHWCAHEEHATVVSTPGQKGQAYGGGVHVVTRKVGGGGAAEAGVEAIRWSV